MNRIVVNYSREPLTSLAGDIVADLLNGSVIIEARNDGVAWHILVERPAKLSECNGRVDDTWKYAYYQQFGGATSGMTLAATYNFTKITALKNYRDSFAEDRMHQYRAEQSAKNLQAVKDHLAAGRIEEAKDAFTEITVKHYDEARKAFEAAGISIK